MTDVNSQQNIILHRTEWQKNNKRDLEERTIRPIWGGVGRRMGFPTSSCKGTGLNLGLVS